MILPRTWSWLLSSGICGMLLVAGCASQTKHEWLTFFFDGVSNPRGAPLPAPPGHPSGETTPLPPARVTALAEPPMFVHQPYADRKCVECHASNYSQRLKGEVSAICTGCHKMFLVKAKYTHAPVEDGQCTLCHQPHQAQEKFLLVKNSRELCFDCHDPEYIAKIPACSQSDATPCTACHNPHQEDRRFLLHGLVKKTFPAQKPTSEK